MGDKCTESQFGRPDSKRLPVIYGCRMEYNIMMDLTDLRWVSVKRNDVAVDLFNGWFF
jgi:hypothetical protein